MAGANAGVVGKSLPSFSAGSLKFLKGEPTDVPPKGHPAVIELWASCGIPAPVRIARKYKDKGLKVIGIGLEEDAPQLKQFVDSQGSKMDYTVAVDPRGAAGQQLMSAAQVSGIPHAFVVDRNGVVVCSGHPADPAFQAAIDKVVKEAPAEQQQQQPPPGKVTKSKDDLAQMSIHDLKSMLRDRGVDMTGVAEKGELVQLVVDRCT